MSLSTVPDAVFILRQIEAENPTWSWDRVLTSVRKLSFNDETADGLLYDRVREHPSLSGLWRCHARNDH